MAHLHLTGDFAPRAWWQEVQLTFVQVLRTPEWMSWREAILEELSMLGSIGKGCAQINEDPRPTYDWSFYVWYNGVDPTQYKAELRQTNVVILCCFDSSFSGLLASTSVRLLLGPHPRLVGMNTSIG